MRSDEIACLMASHLIVADEEINQRELDVLSHHLSAGISEDIKDEQKKIFSDDEEKRDLKDLIQNAKYLPIEEKKFIVRLLYQVAYADGYYDDREHQVIEEIAEKINIPRSLKVEIEESVSSYLQPIVYAVPWNENLKSIVRRLLQALKNEEEDANELLSGIRFIQQIRNIANWSKEDLVIAEQEMKAFNHFLHDKAKAIDDIVKKVNGHGTKRDEVRQLQQQLNGLNEKIRSIIIDSLEESLKVLNKKKRTINYFTIAFMGRTKAGKSTFHKVVTHEQDDDIGVGKQRTTRYNRSWYWENLRIIDTPGIGAAGSGGRTDEEVARSIIDEADLVCYIVTNDSIQETEFNFLQGLKEKNKPLFIILNVKKDIENRYFKIFLKDPLKWKHDKGPQCIDGHIQRIIDCIGDKYDSSSMEIIPIQLLAAKMYYSSDSQYTQEQREKFYLGSNIQQFITEVKKCVYESGNVKKTQNIIDGCGTQIYSTNKEIRKHKREIDESRDKLVKLKTEILTFIEKESQKAKDKAAKIIDSAHTKLCNNAIPFAEDHYEEKNNLGSLWKNDRRNSVIYDEMNSNLEGLINDFSKAISDRLKEGMSDIGFLFSLQAEDGEVKSKGTTKSKRMYVNILGGLAITALTIWNPLGWGPLAISLFAMIGDGIVNAFSRLFKSKEEIIKEKKEKITNELTSNIENNKRKTIMDFQSKFDKSIGDFKRKLSENFDYILDNSKELVDLLEVISKDISSRVNRLNVFFAYRILQHLYPEEFDKLLTLTSLENVLSKIKIERDYENHYMHLTSSVAQKGIDEERIGKLIQQKIEIN